MVLSARPVVQTETLVYTRNLQAFGQSFLLIRWTMKSVGSHVLGDFRATKRTSIFAHRARTLYTNNFQLTSTYYALYIFIITYYGFFVNACLCDRVEGKGNTFFPSNP